MNLAEVMAAAVVLACASSGSLQIWAASAAASRTAEQRQAQLVALDGALLEAEGRLRQLLAASPPRDCGAGAEAIAAALEAAPPPPGVHRQLEVYSAGVWLRLQAEPLPQRSRWLDAAALGHCAPEPPAESDHGLAI